MCPYILCTYTNSYESYVHVSWHAECSNYALKLGHQQVFPSNCNALPVGSAIIQLCVVHYHGCSHILHSRVRV